MTPEEIRVLADELEAVSYFTAAKLLHAYADLLQEREAEERLLREGYELWMLDNKYRWAGPVDIFDKDRSEATRRAMEALNK